MFNRLIAVTLSLILAAPGFAMAPSAQGPTCAQIATGFAQATQTFVAAAEQQNLGFIDGQIFANQTQVLKTLMENSSQGSMAANLKDEWDKMKAQYDRIGGHAQAVHDLYMCLAPGSACNLTSFRERATDEIRRWLDRYGPEGLNALRERALEASNLMHGYLDKVTKISTNTMTAMEECATPMRGQPRVDPNTGQPVPRTPASSSDGTPAIPEPTPKPVDPPEDGGGAGKAIIWGLVGAAGVAYGVTGLMPAEDGGTSGGNNCRQPSSNPLTVCSSQGGSSTACRDALSAYGTFCRCSGYSGFNAQRGGCQ